VHEATNIKASDLGQLNKNVDMINDHLDSDQRSKTGLQSNNLNTSGQQNSEMLRDNLKNKNIVKTGSMVKIVCKINVLLIKGLRNKNNDIKTSVL